MAKPVGSLAVRLTADTTDFNRRMQRATRTVGSMSRQMRKSVNQAGRYAAAITAAGAAIGGTLVANAIRAGREIQNMSRLSNASVKTFQEQAYAARTVGIESDKYADILKDLNDRVGDFIATGGGEMQQFFENVAPKVGVTAEQFRRLSGPQAMQLYVQSLQDANLSQQQMTFYLESVADEATALIPLLRDGGAEMKRLAEESDAVGYSLSAIEIQQLVNAQNAIDSTHATLQGLTRSIAADLSPLIVGVSEKFKQAAKDTNGFQAQLDSAVTFGVRAAGFMADAFQGVRVVIKGIELGFAGMNLAGAVAAEKIGGSFISMGQTVAGVINNIIETFNALPGIGLPTIDTSSFQPALDTLDQITGAMRDKVDRTKEELHNLLMQPLPSEGLKNFVEDAREAGEKAAQQVVEQQRKLREQMGGGGAGGEGGDETEQEKRREKAQQKLKQMREQLMTERELQMNHYMQRGETLREALNQELITFKEFQTLAEKSQRAHQDRMTEIDKAGMSERQKFQQAGLQAQAKTIFGQLDNITAGVSQHNKELFKINQIAGIANAIIHAYEGIALTMKSYPYPLNVAMAAAHATAAFAQVNAIRSASFSGGGGTAPSLAGGTAAPPTSDVGEQGQQGGGGQTIQVNMSGGDQNKREAIREFAESLNEFLDDGGQIGRFSVS